MNRFAWLSKRIADIADAWRINAVRRGFVAAVLIAFGGTSAAYLPKSTPIWQFLDSIGATSLPFQIFGTIVAMAGLLLLVDAWFRLRPRKNTKNPRFHGKYSYLPIKNWAILAIWAIPLCFAPPIFSHDAYSYAAQGWMIHNDINPYRAGPGVLPGGFADQVAWVWRETPAPYGPLSLQISHLLVDISGFDPYISALLQRIPALIGVALIGLLAPKVAKQIGASRDFTAWFATLNPVLVIDFIGGAHNDSLMVGLVVLGIWLAAKKFGSIPGWLIGAITIGVAAAIKQPAFLAAYALPLIDRPCASLKAKELAKTVLRISAAMLIAVGVFCLVTLATGLGFGWVNAVNVPGLVVTIAPFMIIGQLVQLVVDLFAIDPSGGAAIRISRSIGIAAAVVVIAVMALTTARKHPHRFVAYGYLVAAFFAPALRSWYLIWGGVMLPWTQPRSRIVNGAIWVTMMLLSYDSIVMAWRNDALAFGASLAVGFWWLARSHLVISPGAGNRRRRIPAGAAPMRIIDNH